MTLHLGMHEMNKTLENYSYNANSNSLKKVSRKLVRLKM